VPRNTAVDWFRLIPFFVGYELYPQLRTGRVYATFSDTSSYCIISSVRSYIIIYPTYDDIQWGACVFLVPKHVLKKLIFSATEIQVFIFHPCLVRIPSKSSLRCWWRTSRWPVSTASGIPVVKRWKRKQPDFGSKMSMSLRMCGHFIVEFWWKLRGTSDKHTLLSLFHCDFLSELVDYAVLNPMVQSIGSNWRWRNTHWGFHSTFLKEFLVPGSSWLAIDAIFMAFLLQMCSTRAWGQLATACWFLCLWEIPRYNQQLKIPGECLAGFTRPWKLDDLGISPWKSWNPARIFQKKMD